jgi:Holliday junction resolvase
MSYSKGARRERELLSELNKNGYVGLRAPSSGSTTQRELPDIIAGKDGFCLAIEVKASSKDKIYVDKTEIEDLKIFSEAFGSEYYLAVKFNYCDWMFFKDDELVETEKSYRIEKNLSEESQRSIDEVCQELTKN